MQEILFRGQTRRYGEKVKMNGEKVPSNWVYGGVCQGKGDFSIIYGSMDMELEQPTEKRVVYTDTIGQYTGLTDKNGKMIFEGDIGRYKQTDGVKINGKPIICIGKVVYNEKTVSFAIDSKDEIGIKNYDYFPIKDFEIIGNIHDNPELLEGSGDNTSLANKNLKE